MATMTSEQVTEVLKQCFDPEIPVNIVDLGLVYGVDVKEEEVNVTMTLTAPGCPMHTQITADVQKKLMAGVPGIKRANVNIVWEPAWEPTRMSKEARLQLGIDVE